MVFEILASNIFSHLMIFAPNIVSKIVLNLGCVFYFNLSQFGSTFGLILGAFWTTLGVLGWLWATFRRIWASLGVNLGLLGAAWSPWTPLLASNLTFDWFLLDFDLPVWQKTTKLAFQVLISLVSKPVFKFEIKSSNLTMSSSLCRSVVLHGCGGLREAVSIKSAASLCEGCRRRVRLHPEF